MRPIGRLMRTSKYQRISPRYVLWSICRSPFGRTLTAVRDNHDRATFISMLRNRNLSLLLSEQNLFFAEAICERVYLIDRGAIQFSGQFSELKRNPELCEQYLGIGKSS